MPQGSMGIKVMILGPRSLGMRGECCVDVAIAGARTRPRDTASIKDIKGSDRGNIRAGPINISIAIVFVHLV